MSKNIITYRNILPIMYNNSNETYYNKSFKKEGVYIYNNLDLINIPKNTILTKIDKYNVNNYGKLNLKWFNDNITIQNYILNKPPKSKVNLEYYDINTKKIKKLTYTLEPIILPVRQKFPLFEKLDFLNIGGGIFQELNMNIIDSNNLFSLKFIN